MNQIKMYLFIFSLCFSVNANAEKLKFVCDNELEDSIEGQRYYEVGGEIDLNNANPNQLTLKFKEVTAHEEDLVIGMVKANKLEFKEISESEVVYSFSGKIRDINHRVEIFLDFHRVRGLTYYVRVNNKSLPWCSLAKKMERLR